MYVYMYMYTRTYLYTYIYVCLCLCMCMCMCVFIAFVYVHVCASYDTHTNKHPDKKTINKCKNVTMPHNIRRRKGATVAHADICV